MSFAGAEHNDILYKALRRFFCGDRTVSIKPAPISPRPFDHADECLISHYLRPRGGKMITVQCVTSGAHAPTGVPQAPGNQLVAEFVAMGARMVSTGTDMQFLLVAASERAGEVHALREITGSPP
jgi:hypothetical protein